jgi:hypothetical protein
MTSEQKKSNLRMALVLASIAATFLIGFVAKMVMLSH